MDKVWLYENKWEDVEAYLQKKKTVLVPCGSVEQHAQHLPLGTDALVALKVAEDAGKQSNTLVAPPVWTGWAPHHMAYPGTITLRPETLTALMQDICQSLIAHGFEKIIVINGHREANLPPLKIAVTRLRNETGAFISIADPFYIAEEIAHEIRESEPGGIGHAEELETSHMYYLFEELCDPDHAKTNIPVNHRLFQHDPFISGDRVFVPSDVNSYREKSKDIGLVGDAKPATREKGKKYHHKLVNNLIELIQTCEDDVKVNLRKRDIPL